MPVLLYLWQRFLWLGWVGKGIAVSAVLYGIGWVFGSLGLDGAARSFGAAGITVFSVAVAWLFIRLIWRNATAHHNR